MAVFVSAKYRNAIIGYLHSFHVPFQNDERQAPHNTAEGYGGEERHAIPEYKSVSYSETGATYVVFRYFHVFARFWWGVDELLFGNVTHPVEIV